MARNFQFNSTSSRFRRLIFMPRLPDYENCKFTIEMGVTRVETTVISTINVEHAKTRVLTRKVFGKPEKADVIHIELTLSWTEGAKKHLLCGPFRSQLVYVGAH
ncbi:hypothetical protein D8674_006264 [Pyrus ussuriensis x Pyrus communis]|uniref:Uncharacterized protein n=1 Tax=Pyrus ussuriensis x Pyrus communis TaxID=2448454 RepID=A0A5N5FUJ6_9ROSA|nr:hypothetical protein D8674_006264 [Pyrus ussuriensis x Pyrus communis]